MVYDTHPNIIRYFRAIQMDHNFIDRFDTRPHWVIVMERFNTTLSSYWNDVRFRPGKFPRPPDAPAVFRVLFRGMLQALYHVHNTYRVLHRNIEPDSFMVVLQPDGSPVVKLLNFGKTKQLERAPMTTVYQGSDLVYYPPELQTDKYNAEAKNDPASDLYCLAAVVLEMLHPEEDFFKHHRLEFPDEKTRYQTMKRLVGESKLPPKLADLLTGMLNPNISHRYKWDRVKKNDYVKKLQPDFLQGPTRK